MKNKKLLRIEKNATKMGDKAFSEYMDNGALEALKGSVRAYNTALKSVYYQLAYKSTKK